MAYYYFDFRKDNTQDSYGLLASILSQLSAASNSCHYILSRLYSAYPGGSPTRKPACDKLRECLKEMLGLPGQGPFYIIIDAIDECPNTSGLVSAREKVLGIVKELVELRLPNIHLCISSRPEVDIRTVLKPLARLQISLHDEVGQKNDILNYIKSVVRSDCKMQKWRKEEQKLVIDTLSSKADGM
jgi:hypothetical protein